MAKQSSRAAREAKAEETEAWPPARPPAGPKSLAEDAPRPKTEKDDHLELACVEIATRPALLCSTNYTGPVSLED